MTEKDKILTVHNLTVVLDKETIVENLSFDILRGESIVIIGPNGSGKTTLLRALINVIPYQGEIHLAPKTSIGYVPQKLDMERNLPLSLHDFLCARGVLLDTNTARLQEVLNLVHLPSKLLVKPISALSGGQFQRALIAFTMIGKPDIVLFDEPTASIDPPGEEQIYETLHRLQDKKGLTLIIVSHDLSLVYRYASKVLCLNKKNLCFGVPEEILNPKVLTQLYGTSMEFYHHIHQNGIRHKIHPMKQESLQEVHSKSKHA